MKTTSNKMIRRDFIKLTATGVLTTSLINPHTLMAYSSSSKKDIKIDSKEVKKDFFKYACSGALFLAVNKHYGYPKENDATSIASLSGGLMQEGYQCGMLLGATLAVGAESFRRYKNPDQAINKAITATQSLLISFEKRAKYINCIDITTVDWSGKFFLAKYFLKGKYFTCMNIAKKWPPEAIEAAEKEFSNEQTNLPVLPLSCASEVARKMGASNEEQVMVAGLAGGMGLSGNACGAVGAAVWLKSLTWFKKNPESRDMYNPEARKPLDAFYKATNSEILCHKICGKNFKTIEEHTEFIKNGGCAKLMDIIAQA